MPAHPIPGFGFSGLISLAFGSTTARGQSQRRDDAVARGHDEAHKHSTTTDFDT